MVSNVIDYYQRQTKQQERRYHLAYFEPPQQWDPLVYAQNVPVEMQRFIYLIILVYFEVETNIKVYKY